MEDFLSVVVVDTKRNQPLEKGEKIKESLPQGPEEGEKYERRKKASTTINAGEPGQGWANVATEHWLQDLKLLKEKGEKRRVGDAGNERSAKGKEICAVRSSRRGNYGARGVTRGERGREAGTRQESKDTCDCS